MMFPIRQPALLMSLIHLRLPRAAEGRALRFDSDQSDDAGRRQTPTQASWRAEQIRLHGQAVRLDIDLVAERSFPAARRVCRSLSVRNAGRPIAERCRIEGQIDSRDGMPLVMSITRSVETATGATSVGNTTFYRLAPLEGFAPPANPCADVALFADMPTMQPGFGGAASLVYLQPEQVT